MARWPIDRVATAGRYHDSLYTIETKWGLGEVLTANRVLDALGDAEAEATRRAKENR